MMLDNDEISVEIDTRFSRWIFEYRSRGVRLASPFPQLTIQTNRGPASLSLAEIYPLGHVDQPDAFMEEMRGYRCGAETHACALQFEWVAHESDPYVLWRWSIKNGSDHPVVLLDASVLACMNQVYMHQEGPCHLPSNALSTSDPVFAFPGELGDLAIYLPGWQSWSYAGWFRADDHPPRSYLRPFTHPLIYDKAVSTPRTPGHFRSEMFAALVQTTTNTGIAFGFVGQRQSFGTAELILKGEKKALCLKTDLDRVRIDPGEDFVCDWACIMAGDVGTEIVDRFAALAGRMNHARIPAEAYRGWCSWYDYGQKISEDIIESNVKCADTIREQVPLDTIQIDDGYQSEIGDWLSIGSNFPSGMAHTAQQIKAHEFQAGLWLAPFIGLRKSVTVREHPEWVLRNRSGFPVNTGLVWNQFGRALDPSHPGYLQYLQQVISTAINDWGFEYLKLDFLYAGVLPGERHNAQLTRAQAFFEALQLIRKTAGEAVALVGSGCPLGPGIGIFDSMRIGPDVAATWKPYMRPFTPLLEREATLPAAVNAIRNTLGRAHLHRRWWINDPDCALVRKERSRLSIQEVHCLLTAIGMSGGSVFLSDRLDSLNPERLALFSMLIPPLPGRMKFIMPGDSYDHPIALLAQNGAIGRWWLLACMNTLDEPHVVDLNLSDILQRSGKVHAFNVWQERYFEHMLERRLQIEISGRSVVLLAIRPKDEAPSWIGDNIHLSQGLVIERWEADEEKIILWMNAHRRCEARVHLYIPGIVRETLFEGNRITARHDTGGIVILELGLIEKGRLEILWSRDENDH